MSFPPQGFRHAATLLLANSVRAIPVNATPAAIDAAFEHLAHELVALADDMRTSGSVLEWLISEFDTTVDRVPHVFDRGRIKSAAAAILSQVPSRTRDVERRDLFLVYVPEDRLPIAAPLAIELTKRRVSVAFADYEVATAQQLTDAIARGLDRHRGGAVLWTKAFARTHGQPSRPRNDRVRILADSARTSTVVDLIEWIEDLRIRDVSK
jgi:hypothetical protein